MDYARYLLPTAFLLVTALGVHAGGAWTWLGIAVFPLIAAAEYPMADDLRPRRMRPAGALAMLWLQLLPWAGLWWQFWTFLAAGDHRWWEWLGAVVSVSAVTAAVGLPVAHELFHRNGRLARFFGNLAAVTLMAGDVELEHRRSHHIETDTVRDVDTPRRGESVYPFIARLAPFFHSASWAMERQRLGGRPWSPRNRVLWAWIGYAALVALFWAGGGWPAAGTVLVVGLLGNAIVCIFSYVQHYGLVRVPGTPIEKRHAWNHMRPLSRPLTFEIVTHSQHHIDPTVPYWSLTPYPDAPRLGSAFGYFLLALVPPLWHRRMRQALERWDAEHASPAERELAAAASRAAGWLPAGPAEEVTPA